MVYIPIALWLRVISPDEGDITRLAEFVLNIPIEAIGPREAIWLTEF